MFRTKPAISSAGVIRTSVGLLVAIVVATGLNFWLVAEIRKEQFAVSEIVRGGVQEDIQRLGTLPVELQWQLVFTIIVLIVSLVSAVALVFVVRAYLASQALLRDTMTLARDILGSIDYGIITTDIDGNTTSINPQASELLSLEAPPLEAPALETSLGAPLSALQSVDMPLVEMCQQVLATGTAIHDRGFSVDTQNRRRELRADCHSLCGADQQPRGTVLHVRDVTQQVLLEQRMRRMERFMGLGTLAAGLHHEIKNPLSALSLHVQLLEEGLAGQIDEQLGENLNVLKTEMTRIAAVLENFRDYASIEQLNATPLDVLPIVQQMIDLIGPQAEQQGVSVRQELEAAPLPLVMGDAVRLEQVLLNLALNALEAMRERGELLFRVRNVSGQVVISVADTGPGIPEDVKGFILDPYFTTKNSGSGMGLAFCEKIVRQHRGQLVFETSSQGTIFHITLPPVHDA